MSKLWSDLSDLLDGITEQDALSQTSQGTGLSVTHSFYISRKKSKSTVDGSPTVTANLNLSMYLGCIPIPMLV
jgi:hypothetical protein